MASLYPSLSNLVGTLRITSLKARNLLLNDLSGPIQADQWQQEVLGWMDVALAAIQKATIEAAMGPSDASIKEFTFRPPNRSICQSQVRLSELLHSGLPAS